MLDNPSSSSCLQLLLIQTLILHSQGLSGVVEEELEDVSRQAALSTLWACLLVGQPLRQAWEEI